MHVISVFLIDTNSERASAYRIHRRGTASNGLIVFNSDSEYCLWFGLQIEWVSRCAVRSHTHTRARYAFIVRCHQSAYSTPSACAMCVHQFLILLSAHAHAVYMNKQSGPLQCQFCSYTHTFRCPFSICCQCVIFSYIFIFLFRYYGCLQIDDCGMRSHGSTPHSAHSLPLLALARSLARLLACCCAFYCDPISHSLDSTNANRSTLHYYIFA